MLEAITGKKWQQSGNQWQTSGNEWNELATERPVCFTFDPWPGRPFQSSLEPHLETIRALRLKRRTWQQVAETLKAEHGLEINRTAVYKFFKRRVRPSARQPLGFPAPTATSGSHPASAVAIPPTATTSEAQGDDAPPPTVPAKKYVFIPKDKRPSHFSDEDLQWNDPLAIDTFGKSVPVDPDAENPFKMRKRKDP